MTRSQQRIPLAGDDLIDDATGQLTHAITINASPEQIWPWLVQMGCHRAGWYSYDFLDNGGHLSAKEIHPELQRIEVGDVIPATMDEHLGFEVLAIDAPRALILGGLFDRKTDTQLGFRSARPGRFWQVTWAFALEPVTAETTRLTVRARAAFSRWELPYAAWIRVIHPIMQSAQLRRLAARVEGRARRDGWRDVVSGVMGAAVIAAGLLSPWARRRRARWGTEGDPETRRYPGDELIADSDEGWTHGIEVEAPVDDVWPWIRQIGANRGGFYSYQWLENLAGCELQNAETIHPEWTLSEGDTLMLHPKIPSMRIVELHEGRYFVAHASGEGLGPKQPDVSWLFYLEPLDGNRCRVVSRFRAGRRDDLSGRIGLGPLLSDTVGVVMDRHMLEGVKQRAEWRRRESLASAPRL